MAQEEIYDQRDRTYSAWHRRMSLRRFIGMENAQLCAMIDLDASLYVEYDDGTKEPLALIETARDRGQEYKNATVTMKLAARTGCIRCQRVGMPALVLLYRPARSFNPASPAMADIAGFRYRCLYPRRDKEWRHVSPKEWAHILLSMREWSARGLDALLDQELIEEMRMRDREKPGQFPIPEPFEQWQLWKEEEMAITAF